MERKRRDRPQVVLANRKKRRSSVRKDITDYMVSTVYRLLSRTRDFANSTVTAASIITPTPSAPELFNFLSPESISNPFSLPLPFSPVFPVLLFFFFSRARAAREKSSIETDCVVDEFRSSNKFGRGSYRKLDGIKSKRRDIVRILGLILKDWLMQKREKNETPKLSPSNEIPLSLRKKKRAPFPLESATTESERRGYFSRFGFSSVSSAPGRWLNGRRYVKRTPKRAPSCLRTVAFVGPRVDYSNWSDMWDPFFSNLRNHFGTVSFELPRILGAACGGMEIVARSWFEVQD